MHWGWYVGGGLLATGVVIAGIALALDDGPGEPAAGKAKVDHASGRAEKMEKPPERADDGKPTGDGSGNDGGGAAPAASAGTPDGGGGKAA
jgi:hypothetical protein